MVSEPPHPALPCPSPGPPTANHVGPARAAARPPAVGFVSFPPTVRLPAVWTVFLRPPLAFIPPPSPPSLLPSSPPRLLPSWPPPPPPSLRTACASLSLFFSPVAAFRLQWTGRAGGRMDTSAGEGEGVVCGVCCVRVDDGLAQADW